MAVGVGLDPLDTLAVRRQAQLVRAAGQRATRQAARARASSGLSIAKPTSVFVRSERGSRFIEPMNSMRPSITAAFACRRACERLTLKFGSLPERSLRLGLIS